MKDNEENEKEVRWMGGNGTGDNAKRGGREREKRAKDAREHQKNGCRWFFVVVVP
jgi:hypothetical protein